MSDLRRPSARGALPGRGAWERRGARAAGPSPGGAAFVPSSLAGLSGRHTRAAKDRCTALRAAEGTPMAGENPQ